MKLLLVDDEAYSREAIMSTVFWDELGIDEVICAENGEEGLRLALKHRPDIILTDVKMPRMNGVDMCTGIREQLPGCFIIFMSGYSDKEYLKSAIRLSAVNYLEKPYQPAQLMSTLQKTVQKCREKLLEAASQTQLTHRLNVSRQVMKNQIALMMLRHGFHTEEFSEQLHIAYPELCIQGSWITFLISILQRDSKKGLTDFSLQKSICELLDIRLRISGYPSALIGIKEERTIILHIGLGTDETGKPPTERVRTLCDTICKVLENSCEFILAVGNIVKDFYEIYESYQAALICLQRSFFHNSCAVIYSESKNSKNVYTFNDSDIILFQNALRNHREEACDMLHRMTMKLRSCDMTLSSIAKNHYIELLKRVYEYASTYSLEGFSTDDFEAVSEKIWNYPFLSELEAFILKQIRTVYEVLEQNSIQYLLPYKIKQYIEDNFADADLSLPALSTQFGVSESYICVIFKKTFHETVNRYILNYRLEKSKEYLKNTSKKIKDISSLVGYPDSNYFIKLFKKATGVTPSEYRGY